VLYNDYLLPFELASVLFLIAMIGAVMLGRREAGDRHF
jgi:NADH-quinone oxidoreductase subunit J